jgi:peptide/nickel transport system ATP-binding protein
MTLLRVQNLQKHFKTESGLLTNLTNKVRGREPDYVRAVDGISFELEEGETLGIAGESGCGKSTTGMLLTKLYEPTGGDIFYRGNQFSSLADGEMDEYRQNVQMIFQDPFESLNPSMTVYDTLAEPLRMFDYEYERDRIYRILRYVGLQPPEEHINSLPGELSGGMRQRVAIARALILDPDFIVADEPVSMLDVSLRAGVLSLMNDMTEEFGLSVVYISHDISLLQHMCDRIAIMYMGKIVEIGSAEEIVSNPKHPYTQALINAVPVPNPNQNRSRVELPGEVGDAVNIPQGCRFKDRCPEYMEGVCDKEPTLEKKDETTSDRKVSCHLYE